MKKATKKTIERLCGLIIGTAACNYFLPLSTGTLLAAGVVGIIYLSVAAQFDGDSNGKQ